MKKSKAILGMDSGLIHLAGTTEIPIICGYTIASPDVRFPTRKAGKTFGVVPNVQCKHCLTDWQLPFHDFDFKGDGCYFKHIECCNQMTADKFIKCLEQVL